ncbi:histone-lysine N-methyltransferase SETMAR-like [Megalopta genalis]|uniref:histone-lysine N-methyltransferase SETMAR-like n=1 Tax=Megalopta genalis TaxID=115081 RepID=UPI003FCFE9DA
MESQKMYLRHVMLHGFKKGNSAKDTADEICTVYGSGTTTIRTVRDWFKKFRAGNFKFKDEDRSGHPATTNTDIIKTVLTENPRYSVREIVDATNIPKTTENRPSTVAKPGLHPKKVLLCIWWDWKSVVYYELLPQGDTINADKYCNQLDQLKAAITEKRPELARPHVALASSWRGSEPSRIEPYMLCPSVASIICEVSRHLVMSTDLPTDPRRRRSRNLA